MSEGSTRRKFLSIVGTGAIGTALAGCSTEDVPEEEIDEPTENETEADDGETASEESVIIVQGQFPSTLDPHNHAETPTDNVLLSAYEQLLFRDADRRIVGQLSEDWERVEDGVTRFEIREGVRFHEGGELSAADCAFSINRIMDDEVGDLASAQKSSLAPITGAEATEEYVLTVESDGFNPVVFSKIAGQTGQIVQQSWIEDRTGDEIAQSINGTGPFRLSNFEQDVEVAFDRFDEYWNDPADVSGLVYRSSSETSGRISALLAGEADLIVNVPPQDVSRVDDDEDTRIEAVPSLRMVFCAMKYNVEPFDSVEFRQAMNYAVDNQSILDNVLGGFGQPVAQPTQHGVFGMNEELSVYERDVERAEALVDESGYAGAEIVLHTPVGRYLQDVEIAQSVAGQINDLSNVTCTVEQRDFASLAGEVVDGNIETSPDFYLLGYANAIMDATFVMEPLLTSGGSLTSYMDEEVDRIIAEAQREADDSRREALLQEANQLYHDRAPWVFLHQQANIYGVSERIEWKARDDEFIDAYALSYR